MEFDDDASENEKLKKYLNSHIEGNSTFKWHRYNKGNKSRLKYKVRIETEQELLNGLKDLRDFVAPFFIAYQKETERSV